MASSNVWSHISPDYVGSGEITVIKCVATADDSNDFLDEVIPTDLTKLVQGMYLHSFITVPDGTTAPDDNTDFVLNDSNSEDLLGGTGLNAIDNATIRHFFPQTDSVKMSRPIFDEVMTQVLTDNSTADAITNIYYIFTKQQR